MRGIWQVRTLIAGVVLAGWSAAGSGAPPAPTVERDGFREAMARARPAEVLGKEYSSRESDTEERRTRVILDLGTGRTTLARPGDGDASGPSTRPGKAPDPLWAFGWNAIGTTEGASTENPASSRAACTPPQRRTETHEFPWKSVYKLLMRFHANGVDHYTVCSASSFGSFHLLTAGHCIFNHDPNGDGNTADAMWASEVWAWPAQTDVVNPFGDPDRPFGYAKVTVLDTYYGWIDFQDLNYDIAYVALDRHLANGTGWMGREAGVTTSTLNFDGYPSETPYVPVGELAQYPGWDTNNVVGYTNDRIQLCAYTYGGHSGGPVWRYDPQTGNRFVQGVNSTSNREGYAEATRITAERLTHMDSRIINDTAGVPPVARPELNEFLFSYADDTKDLWPNLVEQGKTFYVQYNLMNVGFANSGPITVDFYLSTNDLISTFDTKVRTVQLTAIDGGWFYIVPNMPLPATVPPGTYWVGWIMRSTVPEYGGDFTCTNDPCSNVVVVGDETLTVVFAEEVFEDGFESGTTSAWN